MRLAWLLGALLLCSVHARAQNGLHRWSFEHPQMGTVFRIVLYGPDSLHAALAAQAAFRHVDTLNAILSDYLPESETNALCRQAGMKRSQRVSRDLWHVLRLSGRYARRSNGAFDCTVGPLSRLWRRARHFQELPDTARVQEALALVGYRKVRLYPFGRRVRLETLGMQLDFGGIAQGYAADACRARLRKLGFKQTLIDAGGDIALGQPPPGARGWAIEVPGTGTLYLRNCGITSSGATYRYLETDDGRRFSHIFDPRTGWGVTHRVLVTVKAPTATAADAWATALSVSGGQAVRRPGVGRCRKWKIWLTETSR